MQLEPKFAVDSPPSIMERVIAATPRVALGGAFILIGLSKFDAHSTWVAIFQRLGAGTWFRYFTGAMQITGGALALIPATAVVGLGMIACTMAGAVVADLFVLHFGPVAIFPFALLVATVGAAWQAWMTRH
ncbi:MAG TPA: hypothetical protein VL484_09535 [Vicinamibacterales bacterium]|jgi:putative oxidoreductase|nr:hypothetical protein [Vicinamibacterales bacterium]